MKLYGLLLLMMVCTQSFGIVFKIEQWTSKDSKITFFHVVHKVEGKVQQKTAQRREILSLLQNKEALLIVEDNQRPESGKVELCSNPVFYDASKFQYSDVEALKNLERQPLIGISSYCMASQIPFINVEFRQAEVESTRYDAIKISSVLERAKRVAMEIAAYDDGQLLNDYYRYVLQIFNQFNPAYFNSIISNDSIKMLISKMYTVYKGKCIMGRQINSIDQLEKLVDDHFTDYHKQLIDARILHAIYSQKNTYKNIFVMAGSNHIKRILPVLKALNYKQAYIFGKDFENNQEVAGVDIKQYTILRKEQKRKKAIEFVNRELAIPGITGPSVPVMDLDSLNEIFNDNVRKMNKEIKRIGKPFKKHTKKKLYHSFKKNI